MNMESFQQTMFDYWRLTRKTCDWDIVGVDQQQMVWVCLELRDLHDLFTG